MQVSDNKQHISELKAVIEQRRVQRSMASLNDPSAAFQSEQQPDPAEESAKAQIEQVSFGLSSFSAFEKAAKAQIEQVSFCLSFCVHVSV